MAAASGMVLNRSMAAVPNAGPMASTAKAGPQPAESAITGRNRMGAMVSRNPMPVWKASAVPR